MVETLMLAKNEIKKEDIIVSYPSIRKLFLIFFAIFLEI